MRVGDVLVSVDGKNVQGATLATALSAIETARRRVRIYTRADPKFLHLLSVSGSRPLFENKSLQGAAARTLDYCNT